MSQAAVKAGRPREAVFRAAGLFVLLMAVALRAFAGSATLGWDPVTSPSLAGYMLYYGPSAGNYTTKIDVGNVTTRVVGNLADGATYHFAVTAYDASRTETRFSNDVSATTAFAAPVANFGASITSGVAPLAMNFTSTSTGTISAYAWTLGDGTTSTAQNPTHVYSVAGSYTVALTVSGPGGTSTKTMPNYVNVTSPPTQDTKPPSAPGSLAAVASGSSGINLAWSASTDNVGVTGYQLERCQGAGCASFAQIATSSATTFGDAGLAAGTSYSYRVRAVDAAGNASAYSNVASAMAAAPGALAGSIALSTFTVNLTKVGTNDWARWPSYIHSATGGSQISNIAWVGGAAIKTYSRDARTLKWSNGMPTLIGSANTGVLVSGSGEGFQLTAPADTTTRTLTVYLGAQSTTGTLAAHLSDGSAADYIATITAQKTRRDGAVTLQYRAKSPGQTIIVSFTQTGSARGNLSLQAAALAVAGP